MYAQLSGRTPPSHYRLLSTSPFNYKYLRTIRTSFRRFRFKKSATFVLFWHPLVWVFSSEFALLNITLTSLEYAYGVCGKNNKLRVVGQVSRYWYKFVTAFGNTKHHVITCVHQVFTLVLINIVTVLVVNLEPLDYLTTMFINMYVLCLKI